MPGPHRKRKTKDVYENYENCVPLGYYAASSGHFLLTFRNNYLSHFDPWGWDRQLFRSVANKLSLLAA